MKDLLITLLPLCAAIYTSSIKERYRINSSVIGIVLCALVIVSIWADYYFSWMTRSKIIGIVISHFDIILVYAWWKSKNGIRRIFYMTYAVVNLIFILGPILPLKPVGFLALTISLLIAMPRIISYLKADGIIK